MKHKAANLVAAAVEAGRITENEWDPTDLDGLDILDLDAVLVEVGRITAAARLVRGEIEKRMAADILQHGAIRLGDDGYYVGRRRTTRVLDAEGACLWVAETAGVKMVGKAFRLEPRLTVLRGIAVDAGVDPDAVINTFFDVDEDPEPSLQRSRGKWVEGLAHGERRR